MFSESYIVASEAATGSQDMGTAGTVVCAIVVAIFLIWALIVLPFVSADEEDLEGLFARMGVTSLVWAFFTLHGEQWKVGLYVMLAYWLYVFVMYMVIRATMVSIERLRAR